MQSVGTAGFPQISYSWKPSSPNLMVVAESPNRSSSSQAILNCSRDSLGVSRLMPIRTKTVDHPVDIAYDAFKKAVRAEDRHPRRNQ